MRPSGSGEAGILGGPAKAGDFFRALGRRASVPGFFQVPVATVEVPVAAVEVNAAVLNVPVVAVEVKPALCVKLSVGLGLKPHTH